MCEAIDGRLIFFLPHDGVTIIGTTDDDTFELPEDIQPTWDEVAYLYEGASHVYPAIRRESPSLTYWGVRPTLYARGQYEDMLPRSHVVIDHARVDGVEGAVSIAGGKLATYRIMAAETTDMICTKLGNPATCRTADQPMVGAELVDPATECPTLARIRPGLVERLYRRYGSGIRTLEAMVVDDPQSGRFLDPAADLTEAELRYAVTHEWVRTVGDLSRRTGWGSAHRATESAVHHVVRVMGELMEWDGEQRMMESSRFVEAQLLAAAPLSAWKGEGS
jgi:glycerol-3-phosphate dehydrogenase